MEKENTDLMFNAAKTIYDYPGTDENCKAELVKMFPELEPEDEKFARIVLNLSFKHEADYKFARAYLEKQKEQKPAEWSEEDEMMLCMIECDIRCQIAEGNTPKEEGNQRISWLKSLRPQAHWKPSEDQMKALEDAFRKDGGNEYRKVINSLYRDLEKLL